jgi:GNAT-family acetyltransferase (TIGR03103 family)
LQHEADLEAINRIYSRVGMVPVDEQAVWAARHDDRFTYYVARPHDAETVLGVMLGVDHTRCFEDLFNSTSLWALAVDPHSQFPAVGAAMVTFLANAFAARGRSLLDLSVMQGNEAAIGLYERLGFERAPVLLIKRRNQINEPLFVQKGVQEGFNPYATIIINEALRRGIAVEPLDPVRGYFRLSQANRRVVCWESLSDLTSAIAICRCADKQLTSELLAAAGLLVPPQQVCTEVAEAESFLAKNGRVVVKPLVGEQGQGVAVDIRTPEVLQQAFATAQRFHERVLLERFCNGSDLRVIVINYEVVAAAIRRPAEVRGTGRHSLRDLLDKVSRRRSMVTGGESSIPVDAETERCIAAFGYSLDSIVPEGELVQVRRTANLHTGGTIHDVTAELSDALRLAAVKAAMALEIPVVGLDLLVPDVAGDEYVIIEANERPGLANHEPQPTAERFIDLLFPHVAATVR